MLPVIRANLIASALQALRQANALSPRVSSSDGASADTHRQTAPPSDPELTPPNEAAVTSLHRVQKQSSHLGSLLDAYT